MEIIVAMSLTVFASTMIYVTFSSVTRAWRRGTEMTADLHHGDFVMDQLVMALRSAYYPRAGRGSIHYGFWLEDAGSGEVASDSISWVKRGATLTGTDSPAGPHRVKFLLAEDDEGKTGAAVKFWFLPYAQPDDFDPEHVDPVFLSKRVKGFDCEVATNMVDNVWNWEDTWEDENTNRLPYAVKITLYLSPLDEGEPPIEISRAIEIPVAHLSHARKR